MPMRPASKGLANKGPIITDFEEVTLPDDELGQPDESSVDLQHLFSSPAVKEPSNDLGDSEDAPSSGQKTGTDSDSGTGTESATESAAEPGETVDQENDGECPVTAESTFEAILFVGNLEDGGISTGAVCDLLRGVTEEEVSQLAERISTRWQEDGRPYRIQHQGDTWSVVLDKAYEPVRARFYSSVRQFQLPQSSINILAVVAYQQPITAEMVAQNLKLPLPPTGILNQLVRRRLLQIEPVYEGSKRINQYRTTERFLELYGLESLDELPQSEDLD